MSLKIHDLYIFIKNVNIASQPDVDAIVNAANAKLPPGSSMRFTKSGNKLQENDKPEDRIFYQYIIKLTENIKSSRWLYLKFQQEFSVIPKLMPLNWFLIQF